MISPQCLRTGGMTGVIDHLGVLGAPPPGAPPPADAAAAAVRGSENNGQKMTCRRPRR